MTIAILQTGTTTAIVSTGTTTAIIVTETAEGGGAGPAGSSKQVGVSIVNKQIRETVPPKKRRLVESQFVLQGKLLEKLEVPTRIRSTLKALCSEAELTISSTHYAPLKTRVIVSAHPLVNMGARIEIHGKTSSSLSVPFEISGEKDYSDLDRLIELAKLVD